MRHSFWCCLLWSVLAKCLAIVSIDLGVRPLRLLNLNEDVELSCSLSNREDIMGHSSPLRLMHNNRPIAALDTQYPIKEIVFKVSQTWKLLHQVEIDSRYNSSSFSVKLKVKQSIEGKYKCVIAQLEEDITSSAVELMIGYPVGKPHLTLMYGPAEMNGPFLTAICEGYAGIPAGKMSVEYYKNGPQIKVYHEKVSHKYIKLSKNDKKMNMYLRKTFLFMSNSYPKNTQIVCSSNNTKYENSRKITVEELLPGRGVGVRYSPEKDNYQKGDSVSCRSINRTAGNYTHKWINTHHKKKFVQKCIRNLGTGTVKFICWAHFRLWCRVTVKTSNYTEHVQEKLFHFYMNKNSVARHVNLGSTERKSGDIRKLYRTKFKPQVTQKTYQELSQHTGSTVNRYNTRQDIVSTSVFSLLFLLAGVVLGATVVLLSMLCYVKLRKRDDPVITSEV